MFLTVAVHVQNLRWAIPTFTAIGSAPTFICVWGAVRVVTAILPRRVYTNLDDSLYSLYQRLVVFFYEAWNGTEVRLYGEASELYQRKENVIFICNHQCTVDWVVALMVAAAANSVGSVRYILKDGLKFFPLYGFYLRQHSCIYVKRGSKFDQAKADKQIAEIKKHNLPVWIVIFPEGTRINPELPEVIERSKEFAKGQGFEEFHHVLTPKLKAFQTCVEQLDGHLDAVYDLTIAYSHTQDPATGKRLTAPGMLEFLTGQHPEVHLHFRRVDLKDIPRDGEGLKHWLWSRFHEKDRLLSHFYSENLEKRGRFPGPSGPLVIPKRTTLPPFVFFGSSLAIFLATEQGRSLYSKVWLFGSLAGCLWMLVRS